MKKRVFNFQRWLIAWLRRGSYRVPGVYSEVRTKARISRGHYLCAGCGGTFGLRDTAVDHIRPIVDPARGFTTWDDYITRMFCGPAGLQVLCKPCHKAKTKEENAQRKKALSK